MQHPVTTHIGQQAITTSHGFNQVTSAFLSQSLQQQHHQTTSDGNANGPANTVLVSSYMSPMMSAPGAPRMSFADMMSSNTSVAGGGMRLPLMSPVGLHGLPPGPRTPDGQPLLSPMGHTFAGYPYPPMGVMPPLESPTGMMQVRVGQHSPAYPFQQPGALHQQVFFPSPFEDHSSGARAPTNDKMSWLDAAEIILGDAGQALPLKEIRQRIKDQGLVGPNVRSSLETLMNRDAQKGSKRFIRLDEEQGIFRLMTPEEKKAAKKSNKKSSKASTASTAPTSATTTTATTATSKAASKATAKAVPAAIVVAKVPDPQAERNAKFKRKCQNLRRLIKAMVFENAALCDEVARTEAKLPRARAERRFLLLRLLHYQALTGQSILDCDRQAVKKEAEQKEKEAAAAAAVVKAAARKERAERAAKKRLEREKEKKKEKEKDEDRDKDKDREKDKSKDKGREKEKEKEKDKEKKKDKSRHKHKKNKKSAKEADKKAGVVPVKKKKASSSLKRHILPIPMTDEGQPIFPIVLGSLTVYSLGEVLPEKSSFHSDRFIYPAGFHSTRVYGSMTDPQRSCTYTCKILVSDGDARFEISTEGSVLFANSAMRCHRKLLQAINRGFGEDIVNESRDRAQEFFGFSHPTIQNLIQGLDGATRCANYRWLRFEECKSEEREKIAHWYESDPTVCYAALQLAYKKRMDEKKSALLPAVSSSSSFSASASSVVATATATATSTTSDQNLRSLLTSAPIVSPQQINPGR